MVEDKVEFRQGMLDERCYESSPQNLTNPYRCPQVPSLFRCKSRKYVTPNNHAPTAPIVRPSLMASPSKLRFWTLVATVVFAAGIASQYAFNIGSLRPVSIVTDSDQRTPDPVPLDLNSVPSATLTTGDQLVIIAGPYATSAAYATSAGPYATSAVPYATSAGPSAVAVDIPGANETAPDRWVYNLSAGIVPMFMVSLRGSTRWYQQQERLKNTTSFRIEMWPAVLGANITIEPPLDRDPTGIHWILMENGTLRIPYDADLYKERWRHKGRKKLKPGEFGCALSHFMLWRRCVAENMPLVFIMEDDVSFKLPDDKIREILSHLPDPATFDIAYFADRAFTRFAKIPGTADFYSVTNPEWGTYGYALSQRACRNFTTNYLMYEPIDEFLRRGVNHTRSITVSQANRFVTLAKDLHKFTIVHRRRR
eukprot:TRINITY_DN5773_c0_g1_i1.p1 TRINITY_DN5773_c0_g1~~TRINITY_DN5773_c0_g1_i1.p1  ORF type:complete len:424 (+),score=86.32 TRINITY_DN5773_c0_g1_i1:307-1578(+)